MLANFQVDSTKKKVVILRVRVRCQVRRYSCTHRNIAVEETSRWSKFWRFRDANFKLREFDGDSVNIFETRCFL